MPSKKTKTVVSTSEIRTSKARVQKVKKFPQQWEGHQHGHFGPMKTNQITINQM